MTKEQEFRKQTEEAKFEAFSLMCKKVAELEKENAELKDNNQLTKAKEIIREIMKYEIPTLDYVKAEQFLKEIEK